MRIKEAYTTLDNYLFALQEKIEESETPLLNYALCILGLLIASAVAIILISWISVILYDINWQLVFDFIDNVGFCVESWGLN